MTRRTLEELKAFCDGYRQGAVSQARDGDISDTDVWLTWGGYDLNMFGSYYGIRIEGDRQALTVDAYPDDWYEVLPDALYSFDIKWGDK